MLTEFTGKSMIHKLRITLRQFKSNKAIIKYQFAFFNKLMHKSYGV